MPITGLPFDTDRLAMINRAADGFLPLKQWLAGKKFVPDPEAPWRKGRNLDAASMAFSQFFESLLRESSGDADLKARWDAFAQDPLKLCPIPGASSWRSNRGLTSRAVFAVTVSDAVMMDSETREISRADFYAPYWPLLAAAYCSLDEARASGVGASELAFAAQLLSDANPYWPKGGQWKSSRFAKQFVKDILYCYLGLRGLADARWSEAVLLELGEGRRVGNSYTSADAADAIERFNAVLSRVRSEKEPPLEATERTFALQPVGSPPVNARDL